MVYGKNDDLFDRIRANAFRQLTRAEQKNTNLYLDERTYSSGEMIGPERQGIVAEQSSILVFADDNPLANFSHECRYLLYDPQSGKLSKEVAAEFPPYVKSIPTTLKPFHEPVQFIENPILFKIPPIFRCPYITPKGKRYAILFSGMSNRRHLNDLEFLYRVLVDRYAFEMSHIYVFHYDGTLNTQNGVQTNWPGDNTVYRINITGQGTRSAFEGAIDDLKGKLGKDDLLLIHTNNHGGHGGNPPRSDLCTYPSWQGYRSDDFANKLGELPKFSKLIVMIEQCRAGGFNNPIISKSTADATSVASAATEPNNSWGCANWDFFARDWIAAQADHDPYGGALSFNPDGNSNGRIEAQEAFDYANAVKYPADTPNFSESSPAGGDIVLGQEYTIWVWSWWCFLLRELLEVHYIELPPVEYYSKLRELEPELSKLATSLDEASVNLRDEFREKLQAAVSQVFGKKKY